MLSDYSLDLALTWKSIDDYLSENFSGMLVRANGMLDDEDVPKFEATEEDPIALIKPFAIIWHRNLARARVRSYLGTRLDQYNTGFQLAIVANNGDDALYVANQFSDALLGFKPLGGGEITQSRSMYEGVRAIKDSSERPSRFATMDSFTYGWNAQNRPPVAPE